MANEPSKLKMAAHHLGAIWEVATTGRSTEEPRSYKMDIGQRFNFIYYRMEEAMADVFNARGGAIPDMSNFYTDEEVDKSVNKPPSPPGMG